MKSKSILIFALIVSLGFVPLARVVSNQEVKQLGVMKTNAIIIPNARIQKTMTIRSQFSKKNLLLNYKEDGLSIQMRGCKSTLEPNSPKLPRYEKEIIIQGDLAVSYIKTVSMETISFPLPNLPVQVVCPPRPYSGIPKSNLPVKSLPANQVSYFPSDNFTFYTSMSTNQKKLHINIHPVYMIQGTLFLVTDLSLEIGFINKVDPQIPNNNKMDSVILVADEMVDPAMQLKKLQEKEGYKVVIAKLSDISKLQKASRPKSKEYQGYSDFEESKRRVLKNYSEDLACQIITYLQDLVKKDAIDYLTLLGDASIIPPSNYIRSGYSIEEFDSWTPSDVFYSSPLTTADDFVMLIACGRIPVRDKSEAEKVIQKIARYRADLKADWFQNAVVMGGDPFQGDYMGELMVSSSINKDYLNGFRIEKYFKTNGNFKAKPVLDLFKKANQGLIYEIGHGSGSGLALEPGMIMADDMIKLPSSSRLPVLLSIACLNGAYDTRLFEGDYFQITKALKYQTSFSEASVLSEGGAIAYVGGARNNYGTLDDIEYQEGILKTSLDSGYMGYVLDQFCSAYHNKIYTLGDMAKYSLGKYLQSPYGFDDTPGINTFFGFILMGDPTIKLPELKGITPSKTPELAHQQTYKKGPLDLPFIPIDEGLNLDIKTDSKLLEYYIADYDSEKKALLSSGSLTEKTSQGFKHLFENYGKSRLTIRIETPDYKESRIVFHGRYNHDLVVEAREDIFSLRPGEKRKYMATIRNDGIYDEKDVVVNVKSAKGTKNYTYPVIPIYCSRYVWFDFDEVESGEYPCSVEVDPVVQEKISADNSWEKKIIVSQEKSVRIGYLNQSQLQDYKNTEIIDQIKEIGKILQSQSQKYELFPVSFYFDQEDSSTQIDRLNLDILLLDTPNAFDFTLSQYAHLLDNFAKKGGKIVSIASLAKNQIDFSTKAIQPRFGVSGDASLHLVEWKTTKKEISVNPTYTQYFSRKSYEIPIDEVLESEDESQPDFWLSNTEVIAQSVDSQFKVVKNNHFYTLTGTIDWSSILRNPEQITFLQDLFDFLTITPKVPYIQSIFLDPPLGTKNQKSTLYVQIENPSHQTIAGTFLRIKISNNDWIKIPVSAIPPYQSFNHKQDLDWRGISGKQDIEVWFLEQFEKISYHLDPKNEPDDSPLLDISTSIPQETWEHEIMISGSISKQAKLFLGDIEYGINEGGKFLVPLPLQMGLNQFKLIAREGSLETIRSLEITRLQKIELSLRIGDYSCMQSGKLVRLQEAPQIVTGTTFVPLRFIADSFLCRTDWEPKEQKITIYSAKTEIILWIGKKIARVNGKDMECSMSPFIGKTGRTMVPLRFIGESFGAKIEWKPDYKEIKILFGVMEPSIKPSSTRKDPDNEPKETKEILNTTLETEFVNPLCYDFDGTNIYSLTKKGIAVFDANLVYLRTIQVPKEYFFYTNLENANSLFSQPRKSLLQVNDKYLVLTDSYENICIFDKESGSFLKRIRSKEYSLSLFDDSFFAQIGDIEIVGDILYVLSYRKGLVQIDLNTSEILSQINTAFSAYDVDVKNGKIYLVGMNDILILDSNGAVLKQLEVEDYPFLYSMAVNQNGEIMARDLFSDSIYLINQEGKIKKRFPVTSKMGLLFEIMSIQEDQIYALPVFSSQTEPRVHSEMIHMDLKCKILHTIGNKAYEELKKKKDTYQNADNLWILQDESILLSFDGPFAEDQLKRISKDRKKKESIDLTPDNENISSFGSYLVGKTLNEEDKFGCLYDSYYLSGKLVLQITDIFTEETNYILFKPKSDYYQFTAFDFDQERFYGYDVFSGSILVFDFSTGEEVDQISLIMPEQALFNVNGMQLRNGVLYVLDQKNKIVHLFSTSAVHQSQISYQTLIIPNQSAVSSMVISKTGEIYLMDSMLGRIYEITPSGVARQWGDSMFLFPSHFSVFQDQFLVNDWGHESIYLMSMDQPIPDLLKPNFVVYPEKIEKTFSGTKKLSFSLYISLAGSTEPYEIVLPAELKANTDMGSNFSQIFTFEVVPGQVFAGKPLDTQIIIRKGELEKTIPVHLQVNTENMEGYHQSCYFKLSETYFLSKSPLTIQNGFVSMGEDVLRDVYGFSVQSSKNEIFISLSDLSFSLTSGSRKGYIITRSGKVEIDLNQKVEIVNHQFSVPIDTIFQMANIPFHIEQDRFYSSIT